MTQSVLSSHEHIFFSGCGEKELFCLPQEKDNMSRSHALPPTADEFNCGGERERVGGKWSSFPADCVTRTLEIKPVVANKQSLWLAYKGGMWLLLTCDSANAGLACEVRTMTNTRLAWGLHKMASIQSHTVIGKNRNWEKPGWGLLPPQPRLVEQIWVATSLI